jgi:hypothetical protein
MHYGLVDLARSKLPLALVAKSPFAAQGIRDAPGAKAQGEAAPSTAVHSPIPSPGFHAQRSLIADPPFSQTAAGEWADFNLRLIEPTTMFWGVVNREPIPQRSAFPLTKAVHQRLSGMGIRWSIAKWKVAASA